jgi:putative nucleic acid modification protein with dual OB domain
MRIVVNHLTRMQPGFVCIAGLVDGGTQHVRPVAGRLTRSLTAAEGGPFDMATLVDIGQTQSAGSPPEVEDVGFLPSAVRKVRALDGGEFWDLLSRASAPRLREAFGPALTRSRRGAGVAVGSGSASLGVIAPARRTARLEIEPSRRGSGTGVRIAFSDPLGDMNLSVTDLRLYDSGQTEADAVLVRELNKRLGSGTRLLLSVGLTRAWTPPGSGEPPLHWLQVNNLTLEDDPDWRVG